MDGLRTAGCGQHKQSNDPRNNQHNPRYANYWAPLTRKRHPPHPAQPRHTNHWAPRTRKQHQQEHRSQRPSERSDPTQHAKGRTGDCPGPREETTTRRNVTQGAAAREWMGGGTDMGVSIATCSLGRPRDGRGCLCHGVDWRGRGAGCVERGCLSRSRCRPVAGMRPGGGQGALILSVGSRRRRSCRATALRLHGISDSHPGLGPLSAIATTTAICLGALSCSRCRQAHRCGGVGGW